MNRSDYFNYIEQHLSTLATRIELRGKLNILDLHLHSENFYLNFFNKLYNWHLENLNAIKQNVEAIDLIDKENKIIVQVSATATKQKVESTLSKDLISYKDYSFKFISISKDASELRTKKYRTPHCIQFYPGIDIYDIGSILNYIIGLEIEKQRSVYEFIKQELGSNIDLRKIDTNLAAVINIISKEDWDRKDIEHYQVKPFEIERKIDFNKLNALSPIIQDYGLHHSRVNKIYDEFNKQGINKSSSVLSFIQTCYLKEKNLSSDDLFFSIIESVKEKIQKSSNYVAIPYDELELCVNILVVDSFVRCKIYENPDGYTYAVTR
jgi:hypothetical protein